MQSGAMGHGLDRQKIRTELRRIEADIVSGDISAGLGIDEKLGEITDDHEIDALDLASDSLIVRPDGSAEVAGTLYVELRLGGTSGAVLHEAFPIVLVGRAEAGKLDLGSARVNIRSWTG
jgi:hypothetical protein